MISFASHSAAHQLLILFTSQLHLSHLSSYILHIVYHMPLCVDEATSQLLAGAGASLVAAGEPLRLLPPPLAVLPHSSLHLLKLLMYSLSLLLSCTEGGRAALLSLLASPASPVSKLCEHHLGWRLTLPCHLKGLYLPPHCHHSSHLHALHTLRIELTTSRAAHVSAVGAEAQLSSLSCSWYLRCSSCSLPSMHSQELPSRRAQLHQ